jgi:hypothetical protein
MNKFEKDVNKDLVDPMLVEDDEALAKKKETWNMIFLLCPNQADALIAAYEEKGPEALSKAKITIAYETEETTA